MGRRGFAPCRFTSEGPSAGTGEANHHDDAAIEGAEYREVLGRHADLFTETEPGVFAFGTSIRAGQIKTTGLH